MLARAYLQLVGASAAVRMAAEVSALRDRIDAVEMHPLDRRILERQLRARERMLHLEVEGLQAPNAAVVRGRSAPKCPHAPPRHRRTRARRSPRSRENGPVTPRVNCPGTRSGQPCGDPLRGGYQTEHLQRSPTTSPT